MNSMEMDRNSSSFLPSTFIEQCSACSPLRVKRIISQPYFLLGIGFFGLNQINESKFSLAISTYNPDSQS